MQAKQELEKRRACAYARIDDARIRGAAHRPLRLIFFCAFDLERQKAALGRLKA